MWLDRPANEETSKKAMLIYIKTIKKKKKNTSTYLISSKTSAKETYDIDTHKK